MNKFRCISCWKKGKYSMEAALLTFLYYVFLGWYTDCRSMKIYGNAQKIKHWKSCLRIWKSWFTHPCCRFHVGVQVYVCHRMSKNVRIWWVGKGPEIKSRTRGLLIETFLERSNFKKKIREMTHSWTLAQFCKHDIKYTLEAHGSPRPNKEGSLGWSI